MGKTVRLWIREDGQEPKAIERDATTAPGPGRIVDVIGAKGAVDARGVLAVALSPEPDENAAPQAWLEHRQAKKRVVEVTRGPG